VVIAQYSPIARALEADLEDLLQNGSPEAKRIAQILAEFRRQSQLVLAYAAHSFQVSKFLRTVHIEP
jgi:hypothetical protein